MSGQESWFETVAKDQAPRILIGLFRWMTIPWPHWVLCAFALGRAMSVPAPWMWVFGLMFLAFLSTGITSVWVRRRFA